MIASRSRMLCSSSTTSTRISGIANREGESEGAAGAGPALDVDVAAMVLHDPVNEGEADAGSARLGGEEGFEDRAEIGGRDALAGVVHPDHEPPGHGRHRHLQLTALRHRLHGVEAEIPDGLPELLAIHAPRE